MEEEKGMTLAEIFDELAAIYEALDSGISTLAVLEQGADSPNMARALNLLGDYMRSSVEDVGSLARIGTRLVECCLT